MKLEDFLLKSKKRREKEIESVFEMINSQFEVINKNQKNMKEHCIKNTSKIVETVRKENWNTYQYAEKKLGASVLQELYTDYSQNNPSKIESFFEDCYFHINEYALSNTQSRRSRAGLALESIIENLFSYSKIKFEKQVEINGKKIDFTVEKDGEIKYIAVKTTLRERFYQVFEELNNLENRYLITLDTTITEETLKKIADKKIVIITTKSVKNSNDLLSKSAEVIVLEDFFASLV
ncbi:MAG: type II restriction endonuclease [Culicoidibacterales bacterium]